MSKGLSRNAAIAVTCCLWYESKLNPGSQGAQATERGGALNPAGAYGIASWNGPRQAALAEFAAKKGLSPAELTTQLWFVLNEAANSYPKTWAAITGGLAYQDIIPIFVADYENPANHAAEINGALGFASQLAPFVPTTAAPAATAAAPGATTAAPGATAAPPSLQIGNIQVPIELILQLIAPLAESLVSGLIKGAMAHVSMPAAAPAALAPTHSASTASAPAMDFAQIATQIAAELAKLQQPPPAA